MTGCWTSVRRTLVQHRPKRSVDGSLPIHNRREGGKLSKLSYMTAYEIITIFIGILALMVSFGAFVIELLAYLDRKNKRK